MSDTKKSIFERLLSGESVSFNDPDYHNIGPAVENTKKLSVLLNNETDSHKIRNLLAQIIDQEIDESTTVFTPFYTNYGKNIQLGKNVFINHACSLLDLGQSAYRIKERRPLRQRGAEGSAPRISTC